jgi:hypothetical protein
VFKDRQRCLRAAASLTNALPCVFLVDICGAAMRSSRLVSECLAALGAALDFPTLCFSGRQQSHRFPERASPTLQIPWLNDYLCLLRPSRALFLQRGAGDYERFLELELAGNLFSARVTADQKRTN